MADSKSTRIGIGVLVVHGMGEQKPGESASSICETMKIALKAEGHAPRAVCAVANPNPAVLSLDVAMSDGKPVAFHFHEAYWADLDDEPTFRNRLKFWWWGFSMWAQVEKRKSDLPGAADNRLLDKKKTEIGGIRWKLFGAANLVAVLALTLRLVTQVFIMIPGIGGALKAAFRGMKFQPIETIVAYLGDVKLYQDQKPRKRPLEHRGYKPRVAIRRRMIRTMVEVALCDYDRWYVLAHSLGTVVAFNGLMETAEALPNYLDRQTCEELRQHDPKWLAVGSGSQPHSMEPERPGHVEPDERLDRKKLFGSLRGFLTYGSPIDKFSALWRDIVYINPEDDVFPEEFEWLNVYEINDPVAGFLNTTNIQDARKGTKTTPLPLNLGYRTQPIFATAHTSYFSHPEKDGRLPRAVAKWLLNPDVCFVRPTADQVSGGSKAQPPQPMLYFQLVVTYLLLLAFAGAEFAALSRLPGAVSACEDWLCLFTRAWNGLTEFLSGAWEMLNSGIPFFAILMAVGAFAVVGAIGLVHLALRYLRK